MSSSQVFAVESVATGSIVYLAALIFSPAAAGFAFLGALIGSLAGIIHTGIEFFRNPGTKGKFITISYSFQV